MANGKVESLNTALGVQRIDFTGKSPYDYHTLSAFKSGHIVTLRLSQKNQSNTPISNETIIAVLPEIIRPTYELATPLTGASQGGFIMVCRNGNVVYYGPDVPINTWIYGDITYTSTN